MSRSARMAFACAALLAMGATWAQEAATDPLVQQARYWEGRGRDDLAREAWLKLLKARPNDPVALESLRRLEERGGRAQTPGADTAGGAVPPAPGTPTPQSLDRARQLAGAGRYEEAAAEYRKVFDGEPKDGPLALEYWQTVGGTKDGWEPARAAIERLSRTYPNDPDIQVAYAQHLTYRESTRRQGIDMLEGLSQRNTARQPVQAPWRQALLWLAARPGDEPRYRNYIAKYGRDTQVVARLEGIKSGTGGGPSLRPGVPDALGLALRRAYRDLDANRLDDAEDGFTSIRARWPSAPDGAAGLGIVRLKQERFGDARRLLEQASQQSPARAAKWSNALAAARFWEEVRLGQSARDAGDLAEAETHFRTALKWQPGQIEATQGLVAVLSATNRSAEAEPLIASLPADRRGVGTSSMKALVLRTQAQAAQARGDEAGAEALLRQALATDPMATWPRLDLARLYLRQGRQDEARGLIAGLPTTGPQVAESSYIRALLAGEQRQWYDALMALEQVPPQSRTRDMADLQRRAWVHYQSERAAIFARRGHRDESLRMLAGIEPYARTPELLGVVSSAYVDAGESGRALYLLRQALGASLRPDPSLKLAYAGLLLRLGQTAEFDAQVADLERTPNLSATDRATLTELRVSQRLAQADRLRQSGDIARAYELLEPLLRISPEDPRIILGLARLYDQAQEPDRSLTLYQYAIDVDPDNFDAYQGATLAASSLGRTDEADEYLDRAMRVAPEDPRSYQLAATVARARGQDGRALKLLKAALQASRAPGTEHGLRLHYLDSNLQPIGVERALTPSDGVPAGLKPTAWRPVEARKREDRAVIPMPRWWSRGRLVKVGGGTVAPVTRPRYPLPELAPPGMALNKPKPPEPGAPMLKMDVPAGMQQPGNAFGPPPVPLRMDPVLRSRHYAYEQTPVTETPEDSILAQIREIESKRSASFGAGVALRSRDGREGLDQLDDIEGPMEASFAGIDAGRFTARVTPVYIEAGTVRGADLPLFGQVALIPDVSGSVDQSDKGVALGLQYEIEDFSLDVGSTPIGFEIERMVGGVEWKPRFGNWLLDFDISRRSITDSQLSFAGTQDPRTGEEWGAITATGGRLDVTYDFGDAGVYANGEFHVYDGKNVAKNDEVGGGAGAYLHVMQKPTQRVTVGVNFTSFFFDDNLRHFTWGHGGYFSPQRYVAFAVPVEWAGGTKRLSWSLAAALGIQNFHEDAEALFPNDSDLQAAVEAAAQDDPALVAGYDKQSQTGAGASVYGQVEYLISQHLVVGASAAFDNARDYDQTKVLAYVRWFVGKQARVSRPPRPVMPFYDFPKRLP